MSELEIEKASISAIEILKDQKKEKQLKKALEDYITNYPNGLDIKKMSFLLGEILYANKKWNQSILNFKRVVLGPRNEYSENQL